MSRTLTLSAELRTDDTTVQVDLDAVNLDTLTEAQAGVIALLRSVLWPSKVERAQRAVEAVIAAYDDPEASPPAPTLPPIAPVAPPATSTEPTKAAKHVEPVEDDDDTGPVGGLEAPARGTVAAAILDHLAEAGLAWSGRSVDHEASRALTGTLPPL